jgi:hypothetical protein
MIRDSLHYLDSRLLSGDLFDLTHLPEGRAIIKKFPYVVKQHHNPSNRVFSGLSRQKKARDFLEFDPVGSPPYRAEQVSDAAQSNGCSGVAVGGYSRCDSPVIARVDPSGLKARQPDAAIGKQARAEYSKAN